MLEISGSHLKSQHLGALDTQTQISVNYTPSSGPSNVYDP